MRLFFIIGFFGLCLNVAKANTIVRRSLRGKEIFIPVPSAKSDFVLKSVQLKMEFKPSGWADVQMEAAALGNGNLQVSLIAPNNEVQGTINGENLTMNSRVELLNSGTSHAGYYYRLKSNSVLVKKELHIALNLLQPLDAELAHDLSYSFTVNFQKISRWKVEKSTFLKLNFKAAAEYLGLEPKFACKIFYRKNTIDKDLAARLFKTEGYWEFATEIGLKPAPDKIVCTMLDGPAFSESALDAQSKLRVDYENEIAGIFQKQLGSTSNGK